MNAGTSLPALSLDQPLPIELTGRAHGWFGRYRRYPVFSAPWVRGRLLAGSLPFGVFVAMLATAALGGAPAAPPWGVFLQLMLLIATPMLIGPWLGCRVRRQGWEPLREGRALVLVMAGVVVAMLLLLQFAAEPMKQFIAEQTGAVDASGKRKKVLLSVGVSVHQPEEAAASAPPSADPLPHGAPGREDDFWQAAANTVSSALLTFWLAGGLALWSLRRERDGLAALQRERELAAAQAQRRDAELRLSVLAAQVEPHFLFNTLAGLRSAIATDPGRASEMVDRLADYLRASIPRLRSDGAAMATVASQFDIVRAYLGLMAARMPRLRFAVEAAPELLGARCPPLMLISLAENAIKHGVELKIGPACITVTAERTADGRLALRVADDGVGFGHSQAGGGIGLVNLRERLAQLYPHAPGDPERASLVLSSRPAGGVLAVITLPLEFPDATTA
jgi:hypothetical protein